MVRELLTLNTFEKKAILTLVVFVFILSGMYVYFVNQTVINVVERRAIEKEIDDINTHVSGLAFTYMEMKNDITREVAYGLGFVESGKTVFVSRDPEQPLSLNNN